MFYWYKIEIQMELRKGFQLFCFLFSFHEKDLCDRKDEITIMERILIGDALNWWCHMYF